MDAKIYELARRARELLVSRYKELGIEPQAARLMEQGHQPGGVHYAAVKAIISALTPPEGHVVVTRDEDGEIVMVSRQNDDHEVLEVIALTTHAGGKPCEYAPPEGYVLVPVEPTDDEVRVANEAQQRFFDEHTMSMFFSSGHYNEESIRQSLRAVRTARPEVQNVND